MSSDSSFNNGSAQGNDIHLVENAEEVTEDQNGVAASEKNSSSTSNRGSPLKSALKHDEPGSPSHHPDPEHHVKLDLDGSDLTEEDIFRMKSLSASRRGTLSEMAEQSVMSVADSTSNFEEHVPEGDSEEDAQPDENGADEKLDEDKDDGKVSAKKVEQTRVYGGFVFDRNRPSNPHLPKETVTVLNYPFEATLIPTGDDEAEYRKALKDAKVYLIGTAHFSPDSQQDVLTTIANTQPDMVMVELCPSRISILSMDEQTLLHEAKNLNMEKICTTIKQSGFVQGILHVLLLSMSAHFTKELGMAPGGEFRAAHRAAMDVKLCKLILGDRPIHVTLQRALGSLSFFQKLKLFYHIILSHESSITQEEIERCKKSDLLEELLKEMAGEFPMLSKIFVDERDLYMTDTLHTVLRRSTFDKRVAWTKTDAAWQPISLVAVVGMGHVPGIIANWNKTVDVGDLLSVPQPSLSSRVMRYAVKGLFFGVTAYAAYRLGARAVRGIRVHFR